MKADDHEVAPHTNVGSRQHQARTTEHTDQSEHPLFFQPVSPAMHVMQDADCYDTAAADNDRSPKRAEPETVEQNEFQQAVAERVEHSLHGKNQRHVNAQLRGSKLRETRLDVTEIVAHFGDERLMRLPYAPILH